MLERIKDLLYSSGPVQRYNKYNQLEIGIEDSRDFEMLSVSY